MGRIYQNSSRSDQIHLLKYLKMKLLGFSDLIMYQIEIKGAKDSQIQSNSLKSSENSVIASIIFHVLILRSLLQQINFFRSE